MTVTMLRADTPKSNRLNYCKLRVSSDNEVWLYKVRKSEYPSPQEMKPAQNVNCCPSSSMAVKPYLNMINMRFCSFALFDLEVELILMGKY